MKARILCIFLCLAVLAALVPAVSAEGPVIKKVEKLTFAIYDNYCAMKECSADTSGKITIPANVSYDGSGKIGTADYAMAKRSVIGSYTPSDEQIARGDLNGNNKIDVSDYAMIKRHVIGSYVIPGTEK